MTHTLPTEQLIGTSQAAKELKRSRATIARWATSGRLTPVTRVGRGLVFRMGDVEALRGHLDAIAGTESDAA